VAEREYMTVAEARAALGVSRRKIAELIEQGILPSRENPLDKRSKLVSRADVAQLKAQSVSPKKDMT
jgi:excisionase family DNA binding protein